MSLSAYCWNFAALFLILVWILQRLLPGARGLLFASFIAALVCVIPFFGHAPRYWLSGLSPNASVPLLMVLSISVLERTGIVRVFRAAEWRVAWIFGSVAAILLYPSTLGLGLRNFDSYSLGWPWLDWSASLLLFGTVALTAALLLWRGNRFGWVLALAAVAFWLRLQESSNFWDYLLDPLYGVVSLLVCAISLLRRK